MTFTGPTASDRERWLAQVGDPDVHRAIASDLACLHEVDVDWILVRGLEASRPTVVPAIGPHGRRLSDHDLVAVSVRLRG
jgi:hypothetical protein